MSDKKISFLGPVSEAIRTSGKTRQDEIAAHNVALEKEKLVEFIPEEGGTKGHGIGWFQIGDELLCYQRFSNGYQKYPIFRMNTDLFKRLASKLV